MTMHRRPTRARVLAVPYALVRVPLTVLDRSVVQRLPVGSRTRTVFDHGLGTADHWMGLIVADERIVASGTTRIERAGRFSGRGVDVPPRRAMAAATSYAVVRAATPR